jgi:hypothetical protein
VISPNLRQRCELALLIVTLPLWFIPVCIWAGFNEAGRDMLREVPEAFRLAFLGKRR